MEGIAKHIFGNIGNAKIFDGVIFYPLLAGSDLGNEISQSKSIKKYGKELWLRGVGVKESIENYGLLHPVEYELFRKGALKEISSDSSPIKLEGNYQDKILDTLLFEVMPYFIDKRKLGLSKDPSKEEILGMIRLEKKLKISGSYYDRARKVQLPKDNEERIGKLELVLSKLKVHLPSGQITLNDVNTYAAAYLKNKIFTEEISKLRVGQKASKGFAKESLDNVATLLYLRDQRNFEFGGFGFIKSYKTIFDGDLPEEPSDYTAYIKTSQHALRDFDGKVHLFKKCRVGAWINEHETFGPFVIGMYAHPFLPGYYKDQEICIGRAQIAEGSRVKEIISILETGKNTLLYGYHDSSGDFRPHNFLEEKYSNVISEKSRLIKSGKVKITNDPFIEWR